MGGWRVGLAALDRAIEALVSFLEANVVSQLVTVGVELTYFPLGLQGIRVGGRGADRPRVWHQPPGKTAAATPHPGGPWSPHPSSWICSHRALAPCSPQPRVQVAPEPPHYLAALPLGHEGCGAEGPTSGGWGPAGCTHSPLLPPHTCTSSAGFSTAGLCICKEECPFHPCSWWGGAAPPLPPPGHSLQEGVRTGSWRWGHSPAGPARQRQSAATASRARTIRDRMVGRSCLFCLSGSVSSCCWVSAGLPLTVSTLYTLGRALEARGGTHHACCGRATGRSARAIWESSALALEAKSQRMWLEPQLPGQVWPHCKACTPNRPAPVSVETPAGRPEGGGTGAWGERGARGLK